MLAVFCLRLAAGMLACLLLLPARLVNPRYFRTHFLTALGLTGLAWSFLPANEAPDWAVQTLRGLLFSSVALTFAGSFVWALEGAPGGKLLIVLSTLTLAGALGFLEVASRGGWHPSASPLPWTGPPLALGVSLTFLGSATSAILLGAALSAMLMGHIYLIAPAMSLTPLLRLLGLLGIALAVRLAEDGAAAWCWTAQPQRGILGNDLLLFLPVRWGVGFVLPLLLGWMAWQTMRIRSTQSATGILYVVVIFCFLGELTSLLLRESGLTY